MGEGLAQRPDDGGDEQGAADQGQQQAENQAADDDVADRPVVFLGDGEVVLGAGRKLLNQGFAITSQFAIERVDLEQQYFVGLLELAVIQQFAGDTDPLFGEAFAGVAELGEQFLFLVGERQFPEFFQTGIDLVAIFQRCLDMLATRVVMEFELGLAGRVAVRA